ncbi:hypothetical protein ABIE30_000638 [Janthinobacterium lividum]|uniref:hypothetical protein n=1 Tax=Janthinobacterium lividum TaxID=29581 RepID=UPI003D20E7C4
MKKQYKIVVGNTVAVPVAGSHTNESGNVIPFKFSLICKRLDTAGLKSALNGGETQVDEFIADVAMGWRDQRLVLEDDDKPAEFCEDALAALLSISGMGMLCFTAYMKEAGAKAKN